MLKLIKSFFLNLFALFSKKPISAIEAGKVASTGPDSGENKLEAQQAPLAAPTSPASDPASVSLPIPPPPRVILQRPFTTDEIKAYGLWQSMVISGVSLRSASINSNALTLLQNKDKYLDVEAETAVPWWFIGLLHMKESSFDFTTHLHNGDPLTAKTVHVPAGRPTAGKPPFKWVDSAVDAILYEGLQGFKSWDLISALIRAESYNGRGYRKYGINSPYVWCFTNQYVRGHFTSDGVFNPEKVANTPGVAPVMARLIELGVEIPLVQPSH